MLWRIITDHEEGICDYLCRDFEDIEKDGATRQAALEWLENKGYLTRQNYSNAWATFRYNNIGWAGLR